MLSSLRFTLAVAFVLLVLLGKAPVVYSADAFPTKAKAAWVYDLTTDTVLLSKNAEISLPPASMSKLMTLNMLFEALEDGHVTMDTPFNVSTRARKIGGSTMFLQESDRPTARQLIYGIIVNSGNDASVVVAEGLAGNEKSFAKKMTKRAEALGMEQSYFANSSGWPDPLHRMSMKDLGILSKRLMTEFAEYYPIFSETYYDYKGRAPANGSNRNPLLKMNIGADGLKTGHTSEAGYGLAGSVQQGDRRIILAVSGYESERQRAEDTEGVINWAFRQFSMKTLVYSQQPVVLADVWIGAQDNVALVSEKDITLLIPSHAKKEVRAEIFYQSPLPAPVKAGDHLADMVIYVPDLPKVEIPLVAQHDVAQGGALKRMKAAILGFYDSHKGVSDPS